MRRLWNVLIFVTVAATAACGAHTRPLVTATALSRLTTPEQEAGLRRAFWRAAIAEQQTGGGGISAGGRVFNGGTVTSPVLHPDGTAAAPSIAFASEPGSGLYRVGAGNISWQVLGVSRISVDSTNVSLRGTDGGAYFFTSSAGTTINSAPFLMATGGVGKFQIPAMGATDGQISLTNGANTAGVGVDLGTDGTLKVRNRSQAAGTGNLDVGGGISSSGANGQTLSVVQTLTELTTIAAAATTDTAIQMPANAVVLGVAVRVTVAIPTAATFTVGDSGSAARFSTAAVNVALNSTDPGTKAGAYFNASALPIRITPNLTPGTNVGRVRVVIYYYTVTPPSS